MNRKYMLFLICAVSVLCVYASEEGNKNQKAKDQKAITYDVSQTMGGVPYRRAIEYSIECPVCLDYKNWKEYEEGPTFQCGSVRHYVCENCIKYVDTCPLCRCAVRVNPVREMRQRSVVPSVEPFRLVGLMQADLTAEFFRSGGIWRQRGVSNVASFEVSAGDVDEFLRTGRGNRRGFDGVNFVGRLNALREAARAIDLSQAELRNAQFTGEDLSGVNLSNANCSLSNCAGVNFRGATLVGARFIYADLRGANFENVDVRGVDFCSSNLEGARFLGARIKRSDANLGQASSKFYSAVGVDLTGAIIEEDEEDRVVPLTNDRLTLGIPGLDQGSGVNFDQGSSVNQDEGSSDDFYN